MLITHISLKMSLCSPITSFDIAYTLFAVEVNIIVCTFY